MKLLTIIFFLGLTACGSMEKISPTIKTRHKFAAGEKMCMNNISEAIPCESFTPIYTTDENGNRVPLRISF